MLCLALPYNAMPVPCLTMACPALHCNALLYFAMPCHVLHCNALAPLSTWPCNALPFFTLLDSNARNCSIQCRIVLYGIKKTYNML